ncbi:CAAX protease self-immunity [Propionibacterium ruminifibrarum]|uniref:CAAX protease self-immunity n=1 Tax=Propionibacterium ruminifibrarum TaxID=1962131 RepID=A0A375I1N9_9ACTN|nr:type II CAAX endopeptidase family protein [Propionibacterium ruminifibrarum]SPF67568.1 CAAX protease self-immunity [Propionibacterium ruminifibrarum]
MSTAYPPTAYPPMPVVWQQPYEPELPTTPVRYHGLWRSARWRVWRPVVGALVAGVLWFAATIGFGLAAIVMTLSGGDVSADDYVEQLTTGGGLTPELFIMNNLALACSIPIVWLVARIHSQPIGFVHSVTGRFRWRWFGGCLLMFLPLWVVFIALSMILTGTGLGGLSVNDDTVVLLLGLLLTTPIQCAGEEWFFRGGINRLVASCFPQRTRTLRIVSAVTGCAVSSLFFMLAHGAQDPWLNIFYVGFGIGCCLMCYHTGGLEASTAMHIINNMTAMALLPFSDISHLMDRSEGAGSPLSLLQLVFIAVATVLVCWRARARGLATTSTPAPAAPPAPAGPWPQAVPVPAAPYGAPVPVPSYQQPTGHPASQWGGWYAPQQAAPPQWGGQLPAPQWGDPSPVPAEPVSRPPVEADVPTTTAARPPVEADVPTTTTARTWPASPPAEGMNRPGGAQGAGWLGDPPAPAAQQPVGMPPVDRPGTAAPWGAEPSDDVLASWGPPVDRPRIMEGEPPFDEGAAPRQEE